MGLVTITLCFFLFCSIQYVVLLSDREELLSQDPTLWPGHMEPFGSKQKTVEVAQLHDWPDPITFFTEYVDRNKPIIFKGVAKLSPAFTLFDDEYLKSFQGADEVIIYAEPEKKENRTKKGFEMSFKDFIERYHDESLYMVHPLPMQLRKDIRMPPPLRCDETRELMSSQVTWFSSGGTKSVVHNDDVDNINCLYRGSKELLFVAYNKNKKYVPIDRPEGGYSSIDVDKVNYTKYPQLRNIDQYHHASMEEGDCLFIPYHWFHQINSEKNEKGQNLAVNVWFRHVHGHRPTECEIAKSEATMEKYIFYDDEKKEGREEVEEGGGGEGGPPSSFEHFKSYLFRTKRKAANLKTFITLLKMDPLVNPTRFKFDVVPEDFKSVVKELFQLLDVTSDNILNKKDFDKVRDMDEESMQNLETSLNSVIAKVEDQFEDMVEDSYQAANQHATSEKKDEL